MDFKTYIIQELKGNTGFIAHTLSDFSDADMFVRPCPGANHVAWQLGHLTCSEAGVQKVLAPSLAVELPAGMTDTFKMDANKKDDAAQFAPFNTKEKLLEILDKVRAGTVACVESMSNEQLDAASPDKYKHWAPTLSKLVAGQITHSLMHLGQFQVIRRKLGKPVLF